jgi:hypothetical protein
MNNLHPEYAAFAGLALNLIIALCTHYGISVDASTQGYLTIIIMWLVIRLAKRFDPPATEDLQAQIQKNIETGKP